MERETGWFVRARVDLAALVLCTVSVTLSSILCSSFRITRRGIEPVLQPSWVADAGWLDSPTSAYRTVGEVQWSAAQTIGGIVSSVLLAAVLVATVAFCTLVFTRYSLRRAELATRAALGAAPLELLRELSRPIVRIARAGGSLGLLLGCVFSALIRASWPAALSGTLLRTLLAGLAGGVVWLLLLTVATVGALWLFVVRGSLADVLRAGERATASLAETRVREALTCIQIGACVVLLVVGTVLAQRPQESQRTDVSESHDAARALLVTPGAIEAGANLPLSQRVGLLERVLLAPDEPPVVSTESIASAGALLGVGLQDRLYSECDNCGPVPTGLVTIPMHSVGPSFFTLLGAQLVRGRDFTMADRLGAQPVAIVNDAFVRKLFGPRGNGLGRVVRLRLGFGEAHRIVGVVADQAGSAAGAPPLGEPVVYFSALQHPPTRFDVITRTNATAVASGSQPKQARNAATTLHELRAAAQVPVQRAALSVRVLAALCFLLGGYGLHATTSVLVRGRRRELGIRVALGSTPAALTRYVTGYAARLSMVGVILGLAGSFAAQRILDTVLPTARIQGTVVGLAAALLTAMTLIGAARPAWQAGRAADLPSTPARPPSRSKRVSGYASPKSRR